MWVCPGAVFPLSGSSAPSVLLLSSRQGQRSTKVQGSNCSRTYWCLHLCLGDQRQHNILVLVSLTVSLLPSYRYSYLIHTLTNPIPTLSSFHCLTPVVSLRPSNSHWITLKVSLPQPHSHFLGALPSHCFTPTDSIPPSNSKHITPHLSQSYCLISTVWQTHFHCLLCSNISSSDSRCTNTTI